MAIPPATISSFQTNNKKITVTNICENVHPVYGIGIQTHDLHVHNSPTKITRAGLPPY